jgi:hypothetical protein
MATKTFISLWILEFSTPSVIEVSRAAYFGCFDGKASDGDTTEGEVFR